VVKHRVKTGQIFDSFGIQSLYHAVNLYPISEFLPRQRAIF